ncbi:anti-sigma regulatory factor [Longimicrobium terrae]|uniref:Serine/threonine-protein kinase RsbT n=1 Tax=Longimicrobium terrae TaxID=1639882 RepID=A0A841H490_9BACT|nr:anti-sigma regulatory factor [Longimicrobium terrae]MBB4638796.1 serine/threonine-protein kinase RsbT [Longimicrobium terrae]MBB6073035.1 serine/threonine-protein kinase RsbT [Longimicrobium terrae]NNC33158.1 anti-sigma regulatory factor [Longimicrobium terrae]
MIPSRSEDHPLRTDEDVVRMRQAVRGLAKEMGFSLVDQTKLVTAASELGRNAVVYGGGGSARLDTLLGGPRPGLRLLVSDDGPGIPDLELALRDGYTSGNGLGLGLSGSRRLMDEFRIDTAPGAGTRVEIVKWK